MIFRYTFHYYCGAFALLILHFVANSNAYVTLRRRNDGKIEQIFNSEAANIQPDESRDESDNDSQLAALEAQLMSELRANNLIATNTPTSPAGIHLVTPQKIDFKLRNKNIRMGNVASKQVMSLKDSQKSSVNFDMNEDINKDASVLNFVGDAEHQSILHQLQVANANSGANQRKSGNNHFIDKNVNDYGSQNYNEKNSENYKRKNENENDNDSSKASNVTNATGGEDIFVDALKRVLVEFKRGMMSGKFGPELQHKSRTIAHHIHEQQPYYTQKKVSNGIAESSEVRRKPLDKDGTKVWRRVKFTALPSRLRS